MEKKVIVLDSSVLANDINILNDLKRQDVLIVLSKKTIHELNEVSQDSMIKINNILLDLHNKSKVCSFIEDENSITIVKYGNSSILLSNDDFMFKKNNDYDIIDFTKELSSIFGKINYDFRTPKSLFDKFVKITGQRNEYGFLKGLDFKSGDSFNVVLYTSNLQHVIMSRMNEIECEHIGELTVQNNLNIINSVIVNDITVNKKKRYMLDTNVIMLDYKSIEKIHDKGTNDVYICSTVLEELDNHKSRSDLTGYNVRKAIRWMDENEGKFFYTISDKFDGINDDKIIESASVNGCIVVSNDINVRLKCKSKNIQSEEYKDIEKTTLGELRSGKHIIKNNQQMLADIYQGKPVQLLKGMFENDFVMFYDNDTLKDVMQIKNGVIRPAKLYDKTFSGATPKNIEQKMALTLLSDTNLELVTFSGTFGSAKTFMQLGMALELVNKGLYEKIYIAKSPAPLDKSLATGFKTGDFLEKMALPLTSITSNLQNLKGNSKFDRMRTGMSVLDDYMTTGIIDVLSLEDILGTSLRPKSILIVEEAQVLSSEMARAVFSRIGDSSVIFANGDLLQGNSGNLLPEDTGLFKIINAFAGYPKAAHLTLENVVRSGFVAELNNRWDKLGTR